MAIDYNWVCTACGASNVAGTKSCLKCGADAPSSAAEVRAHAHLRDSAGQPIPPRLGTVRKFLIACCVVMFLGGLTLMRVFVLPQTPWWVGIGLTLGAIVLGTLIAMRPPRSDI